MKAKELIEKINAAQIKPKSIETIFDAQEFPKDIQKIMDKATAVAFQGTNKELTTVYELGDTYDDDEIPVIEYIGILRNISDDEPRLVTYLMEKKTNTIYSICWDEQKLVFDEVDTEVEGVY